MPIIRYEFTEFVRLWNSHHIRKQRNRPHVLSGKPWILYHMYDPNEATDYRIPLNRDKWDKLQHLAQLDNIDLDAYLPANTMAVCKKILDEIGGMPDNIEVNDKESPYLNEYYYLRKRLQKHIAEQLKPEVSTLERTDGGWEEFEELLKKNNIDLEELTQIETDNELDDLA